MTRPLREVPAGAEVLPALRAALSGGDALVVTEAGAPASPLPLPTEVPQRVALVVETSGSTGSPKRVALSADALLANAAASESALGGPGQWLLALPTHYIAGLNVLARAVAAGLDPVAVDGRLDAEALVAAGARFDVPDRYAALVPRQLAELLDDEAGRRELARYRAVLVGGQATPGALLDRAADAGVRVVRSYGSSETSGGCVYDGVPIGQTLVRIADTGELELGGPSIAEGYLGDDERTAARFAEDADGRWFRSADAAEWRRDAEGERLAVLGRLDDVLVSGGLKVATGAIAELLRRRPGWESAEVVAVEDARWGQVPVVVVAGEAPDVPGASAALVEVLGIQARPARIVRVAELPRLATGKNDRAGVAELARAAASDASDA